MSDAAVRMEIPFAPMSDSSRLVLGALALALVLSPSCGGERFSTEQGRGGAGAGGLFQSGEGGLAGEGGNPADAGMGIGGDLGGASGATGGAGATWGEPVEVTLRITNDADDAVFITNGDTVDERLKYGLLSPAIEVGTDAEQGRVGLRFTLPIPVGSRIISAVLSMTRVEGSAASTDTMRVEIYDSANVPAFSDQHQHRPQAHVVGGVMPGAVGGFSVGEDTERIVSPNLTELLEQVLQRPDYRAGSAIGFVLSPDEMSGWVMFEDSSAITSGAAQLSVVYQPL